MTQTSVGVSSSSTGSSKPIDNDDDKAAAVDPSVALSEYALTTTTVVGATGYALYRKPRNGIGIMLVAGGAGMMGDFAYGWIHACQPQVKAWYRAPPSSS
eukprot:scaffold19632_cov133-Amphora_coffeaeformis.AAC.2